MRNHRPTEFAAGLTTLVAVTALAWTLWGGSPPVQRSLHEATGVAMARETQKLVTPGASVIVIARDVSAFEQPAAEIQLASFKHALRRANLPIAATRLIQVDSLRPVQVPSGDFFELIRKAAPGQVIVSFMGPPLLTREQRTQLGEVRARVVAFCPGEFADYADLRTLFDQKLLAAAVVSRKNPAASAASIPGGRPPATFAELYVTADANSIGTLAPATLSSPAKSD